MADLPLALALSSVLTAAVDGADRPGLLTAIVEHPELDGEPPARPATPPAAAEHYPPAA